MFRSIDAKLMNLLNLQSLEYDFLEWIIPGVTAETRNSKKSSSMDHWKIPVPWSSEA